MKVVDRPDVADRILDAAQRLVLQTGARRLSLTEVAKLAGVARPTLYRYFPTKDELVDALGKRERSRFTAAMGAAVLGTSGVARVEAAIDVVAASLGDQPPRHLIDLDPGFVNEQMARVLPMIESSLEVALDRDAAGAVARTVLSHYLFPDPDPTAARRHIRAAAGLPPTRARRQRRT